MVKVLSILLFSLLCLGVIATEQKLIDLSQLKELIQKKLSTNSSNPAPFGIKLGISTIEDVKKKFKIADSYLNKMSYFSYTLDTINVNNLEISGVKSIGMESSFEGVIERIIIKYDKNEYDKIIKTFSKKYEPVQLPKRFSKGISSHFGGISNLQVNKLLELNTLLGGKTEAFKAGDCTIIIALPLLSEFTFVSYETKKFYKDESKFRNEG